MPAAFAASSFLIFPNYLFTVFTVEFKLDLSLAAQGFPKRIFGCSSGTVSAGN